MAATVARGYYEVLRDATWPAPSLTELYNFYSLDAVHQKRTIIQALKNVDVAKCPP